VAALDIIRIPFKGLFFHENLAVKLRTNRGALGLLD